MREVEIQAGHIVYSEGDESDAVYIVSEGEIEVARASGDEPVVLARLRRGQLFGEMGVIADRLRSTTTRAATDVSPLSIGKQDFLDAFGPNNKLALKVLRTLCERLSNADQRILDAVRREGAPVGEVGRIRRLPGSHIVEAQIGAEGIEIGDLPYRVGRRAEPGEPPQETPMSLAMHAQEGYQISLEQFAIDEAGGRLMVQDLGSHLGTLVNGQRIASFEQSQTADLGFGETEIQAGGSTSDYRFRIIVERA